MGHKIDQKGIRPLPNKLEAITKMNIPINKKVKIFPGGNLILIIKHRTAVSTNRHTMETTEKKNKTSEYGQTSTRKL